MRILNDILEFSKLEANRMVFEMLPFSPASLLASVDSVLGPRARAKGLQMTLTTDPDLPIAMVGDPGRLRQILLNLLSNAIKFTERGCVAVETRCFARTEETATLEWRIADTGIGIEPDKLDRLFSEYTQADGSINRRFGGSGLGLAICKRLVERMGGTIEVASTPGVGSTFSFRLTLPYASTVVPDGAPRQDAVQNLLAWVKRLGRRPRILIAEDNPTNRLVLDRMLTSLNIDFDAAANGVEAVAAVTRFAYDTICMDVQMPKMDGLQATRAIRALGGWLAMVPIVALTGNAFGENRQACIDAGMSDFLPKPFSKLALADVLLKMMTGTDIIAPEQPANGLQQGAGVTVF